MDTPEWLTLTDREWDLWVGGAYLVSSEDHKGKYSFTENGQIHYYPNLETAKMVLEQLVL